MSDEVNNPEHYMHPSGVQCIDIVEYCSFCLGNAIKYLWRADKKHETPIKDLQKALWYIRRELELAPFDDTSFLPSPTYFIRNCFYVVNGLEDSYKNRAFRQLLLAACATTASEYNMHLNDAVHFLDRALNP